MWDCELSFGTDDVMVLAYGKNWCRALKTELLTLTDRFVEQIAGVDDLLVFFSFVPCPYADSGLCSEDGWLPFLKKFISSVQSLTIQHLHVGALSAEDSMGEMQEELETLRTKVEELGDEVRLFLPS